MDDFEGSFAQFALSLSAELFGAAAPSSLSAMEQRVRARMLELGRLLLGAWLADEEEHYPPETVPCGCGGAAVYERRREGVLYTTLGTVRYQRAYYLCPACHQGQYPLDTRLGLRPGEMSAALESLVGLTGALVPFAKGSDFFERLTLVGISPQSMDKATETLGAEVVAIEGEQIIASQDEAKLASEARAAPEERLYGTLDAVKVHCREKRSADDAGWRDLKAGAWFHTDAPPPATPEEGWEVRARDLSYYCDFGEAASFGSLLWATGYARGALRAREVVFIGDGAEWIWDLVTEHYPQATQIVDWFHARERLGVVAKAAIGDEAERGRWLERVRGLLWEGRVEEVLAALSVLPGAEAVGHTVHQAIHYYSIHRARMDYAALRARGYQIGSGTIESACKQLGILRMKVPGATWSTEGARRTAKARAAFLSDQWDEVAARREHLARAA